MQDVGVKGAALLAGKWLGWHTTLHPGGDWIKVQQIYHPCPKDTSEYDSLFATYKEAYYALKPALTHLLHWSKSLPQLVAHGASFVSKHQVLNIGRLEEKVPNQRNVGIVSREVALPPVGRVLEDSIFMASQFVLGEPNDNEQDQRKEMERNQKRLTNQKDHKTG
eukprot:Gb_31347 [translate_table: standard]